MKSREVGRGVALAPEEGMQQLELERVANHIARAEQLAGARNLAGLTRVQRLVRQLALRLLAAYREAGVFPKNRDFAEPTPYFIDAGGTRCAMAHLLEVGGERELVATIARERNNAYVRELADEPRLLAWLHAAGLTVEEAAAIQPSYCSVLADCFCGGDFAFPNYPVPASGVLEGETLANGMVVVTAIYGNTHGIEVGAEVMVDLGGFAAGTPMLIPVDAASVAPFGAIRIEDDGVHCNSQGTGATPVANPDDVIAGVQANDCQASFAASDSVWAQNSCSDEIDDEPGAGCNSAHGEMSVSILLALAGVLVTRARRG